MKTTPQTRTDLSRLCREATEGPLTVDALNLGTVGSIETLDGTSIAQCFELPGPRGLSRNVVRTANAKCIAAAFNALPDLLEDVRELESALRTLVEKLDAVHGDPRYLSVWMLYANHGGNYTEPTYEKELNAAREALKGEVMRNGKGGRAPSGQDEFPPITNQ